MDRKDWHDAVMALPVFDTHTHLNMPGVPIPAQTVWDIVHYFWFQQELWSVGYPKNAMNLTEADRIQALIPAFNASRNTAWNQIVRDMLYNLYGVDWRNQMLTEKLIREADTAIRWHCWQEGWSQGVIDKLNIKHITVNNLKESEFADLPGVGVAIPVWKQRQQWTEQLNQADDQTTAGEAALEDIATAVTALKARGIRGARVAAEVFERDYARQAVAMEGGLPKSDAEPWQIEAFLSHGLFSKLGEQDMFAQLFLGIERDLTPRNAAMAVNVGRRITNLYPLFERYPNCGFELVVGAPQNNMDAMQAARIYPNVHVGGLWWYNFRASTYRAAMQQRLEACPASKASLVASDARCIEWCYGKILLVKRLLADFMYTQVHYDWISEADALWVAQEWLYDAPARRYL